MWFLDALKIDVRKSIETSILLLTEANVFSMFKHGYSFLLWTLTCMFVTNTVFHVLMVILFWIFSIYIERPHLTSRICLFKIFYLNLYQHFSIFSSAWMHVFLFKLVELAIAINFNFIEKKNARTLKGFINYLHEKKTTVADGCKYDKQ